MNIQFNKQPDTKGSDEKPAVDASAICARYDQDTGSKSTKEPTQALEKILDAVHQHVPRPSTK